MSADTAQRRRRADVELVRRGLVASREEARDAIEARLVLVDGAPVAKPATQVSPGQALVIRGRPHPYVSRGGVKLDHALARFGIDVTGLRCLDAGVSTGGFTDRLLQGGAAAVVAVDVGYGQVHDRIRTDPRVEVRERTNVRDVRVDDLPWRPDLVVADLSFVPLSTVVPGILALVAPAGRAVLLVKPQFEAGRAHVGRGGVVRDPDGWRAALRSAADAVEATGHRVGGITASPITGPAGNVEFLLLALAPATAPPVRPARTDAARATAALGPALRADGLDALVEAAVAEGARVAAGGTTADERPADVTSGTGPGRVTGTGR